MNQMAANAQLIQKMNRLKVLNYIRKNPDVARPTIAHDTGLSVSSMTNIVNYLISKNLVTESGTEKAERVGRKGMLLKFGADEYGLICIFLGIDSISISYTNLEGRIIKQKTINEENLQPKKMVELIKEDVFSLINEYGCEKILGIGISISGIVLDHSRFIVSSSLKWKDVDLKGMLEEETELPVFVENISLIKAVWYFCCDRSIQSDNMLLVDLQNGIGASQYYDGEINRAMLGEIGHTTVEKNGEMCFCGNRGCLETMCSEQRVIRLYEEASGESGVDLRRVAQEFDCGNGAAVNAVNECAKYLGIGLANLVNLCRPGAIVIDTGSFDELEVLIDKGVEEMKSRAYPALVKELEVYRVKISEEDTVKGTAFNLCDRIFDIAYPNNIIE